MTSARPYCPPRDVPWFKPHSPQSLFGRPSPPFKSAVQVFHARLSRRVFKAGLVSQDFPVFEARSFKSPGIRDQISLPFSCPQPRTGQSNRSNQMILPCRPAASLSARGDQVAPVTVESTDLAAQNYTDICAADAYSIRRTSQECGSSTARAPDKSGFLGGSIFFRAMRRFVDNTVDKPRGTGL